MRNLKRALSLAVASVMLLGMMVVGSGASYVDVSSEDNQEAIEVLQAVGIMTGDDNGNFNPDEYVTRGEMAVIMTNLLDLGIGSYSGASTPFTDVPEWAQAYVAACYANGITGGTSATTYGTDENVTAVQAGLMMMKALGYFQYSGDFGESWTLATIRQAASIDLYDGIDAESEQPLTRNEVAQLALNALEANMVEFTGTLGSTVTTSDGTTVEMGYVSDYDDRTSTNSKYGTIDDETEEAGVTRYTMQLGEDLYDGDLEKDEISGDDFGRPAVEWTYDGSTIGTYSDEADATYTAKVSKGDLYDVVGRDIINGLVDQNGDDHDSEYHVYLNGLDITSDTDKSDLFSNNSSSHIQSNGENLTGNGVLTEVYIDDDDNVNICIIYTYLAQVDGDYDEDDEELAISEIDAETNALPDLETTTLSIDDFDNLADFQDEDYVLITAAAVDSSDSDTEYAVQSIALAETATGEMTSNTTGSSVSLDGTSYSFAKVYAQEDAFNNGDDSIVYLDSYGYALYVDANAANDNYVYLADFDTSGMSTVQSYIAAAYFLDGTYAEIDLNNVYRANGTEPTDYSVLISNKENWVGWFTYSQRSNGEYNVTKVSNSDVEKGTVTRGNNVTTNGQASVNYGSDTFRANNSTVFLLVDGDDVELYTGIRNVPTVTISSGSGSVVSAVMDGNYAECVYIDVSNAQTSGASSSSDIIFILDSSSYDTTRDGDGDDYYTYDAIVNGEETTISANDTTIFSNDGLYTEVEYDNDGLVDSADLVDEDYASANEDDYGYVESGTYTVTYDDGVVYFDGTSDTDFVMDDSFTIYVIEVEDDYEVNTVSGSRLESRYSGGTMEVFAVLDGDGYATELYVLVTEMPAD